MIKGEKPKPLKWKVENSEDIKPNFKGACLMNASDDLVQITIGMWSAEG